MLSMKNYVREALLTAALFGSVGAAAASAPENSRGVTSAQTPKVSGHGVAASVATPAAAPAVLMNGQRDMTQGSIQDGAD